MKYLKLALLVLYGAICIYTDRYLYKMDANVWYGWTQVAQFVILLLLTLCATGWLKVGAFALTALCFVELGQQFLHGNTKVDISDNVALIIVAVGTIGFILLRRMKRKL